MRALTIFKQKDLPAETKLKEIPPDEQAILDCIARTKKFVTQRALVTAGAKCHPDTRHQRNGGRDDADIHS